MTDAATACLGGPIFDGERLHDNRAAIFVDGQFDGLTEPGNVGADARIIDLGGDVLGPGFTDLQVNGGGGVMLNDDPSVATIDRITKAHRALGTVSLLPTLITDTVDMTRAAITAAIEATRNAVPGVAGLHLEGPHLSVARKGAHDPALIRPMEQSDLDMLVDAARDLPALMVTVAPENVTPEQVATMNDAGVVVSLGHTDADFETCRRYMDAGARCATHLFNAMSQLGNREPGLVGAVLATGDVSAGLIADGIHVHAEAIRTALAAKRVPGEIFLVSDAMAVAGTDLREFDLNARRVYRSNGRLTLENGTLAGADLDLLTAIRVLVKDVGVDPAQALRAATGIPRGILGMASGTLQGLPQTDFIRIAPDLTSLRFL